jgi:hypothetical protein
VEAVAVPPDRDKCEFQPEQIELRLPMVDAFGIAACSAQAAHSGEGGASASKAPDQFRALALAEAGQGLGRADLALCEQAGDPRRTVLGQGEQERLHLLRPSALGRCCQDVTDPDAACCQRPLQLRSADADFVRSAQCLESLSGGARGRHRPASCGRLPIR